MSNVGNKRFSLSLDVEAFADGTNSSCASSRQNTVRDAEELGSASPKRSPKLATSSPKRSPKRASSPMSSGSASKRTGSPKHGGSGSSKLDRGERRPRSNKSSRRSMGEYTTAAAAVGHLSTASVVPLLPDFTNAVSVDEDPNAPPLPPTPHGAVSSTEPPVVTNTLSSVNTGSVLSKSYPRPPLRALSHGEREEEREQRERLRERDRDSDGKRLMRSKSGRLPARHNSSRNDSAHTSEGGGGGSLPKSKSEFRPGRSSERERDRRRMLSSSHSQSQDDGEELSPRGRRAGVGNIKQMDNSALLRASSESRTAHRYSGGGEGTRSSAPSESIAAARKSSGSALASNSNLLKMDSTEETVEVEVRKIQHRSSSASGGGGAPLARASSKSGRSESSGNDGLSLSGRRRRLGSFDLNTLGSSENKLKLGSGRRDAVRAASGGAAGGGDPALVADLLELFQHKNVSKLVEQQREAWLQRLNDAASSSATSKKGGSWHGPSFGTRDDLVTAKMMPSLAESLDETSAQEPQGKSGKSLRSKVLGWLSSADVSETTRSASGGGGTGIGKKERFSDRSEKSGGSPRSADMSAADPVDCESSPSTFKVKRYRAGVSTQRKMEVNFSSDDIQIHEKLGRGATGSVYRASIRGVSFACKVMEIRHLMEDQILALKSKVLMMESLQHENVTRVLGHRFLDESVHVFLEYMPETLRGVLDRRGIANQPLKPLQIAKWASQIASGLAYLHKYVSGEFTLFNAAC